MKVDLNIHGLPGTQVFVLDSHKIKTCWIAKIKVVLSTEVESHRLENSTSLEYFMSNRKDGQSNLFTRPHDRIFLSKTALITSLTKNDEDNAKQG